MKPQNVLKKKLLDLLDFLHWQVENDKCTMAEIDSISRAVTENLEVEASIKDIANFYGQSETNVSVVASRHYIPKDKTPKRRVLYNFAAFLGIVPKTWKRQA